MIQNQKSKLIQDQQEKSFVSLNILRPYLYLSSDMNPFSAYMVLYMTHYVNEPMMSSSDFPTFLTKELATLLLCGHRF